ncbi:hypothetical protein CHUAL_011943 [Chamberlinius hualienensis]
MKPQTLLIVAAYSLSVIGLSDQVGVFSLTPASLLLGLPFTVTGVSSGTLAALGALKLLAATALALSYTGQSLAHAPVAEPHAAVAPSYGYGEPSGYNGGYAAANSYSQTGNYGSPIYKRSVADNTLGNLELYFHIINEVDANNCALRLICELQSVSKDNQTALEDDERMILALFGLVNTIISPFKSHNKHNINLN